MSKSKFRLRAKLIQSRHYKSVYQNAWEVQELVRIHIWPWPKTWITRAIFDSPLEAYNYQRELQNAL